MRSSLASGSIYSCLCVVPSHLAPFVSVLHCSIDPQAYFHTPRAYFHTPPPGLIFIPHGYPKHGPEAQTHKLKEAQIRSVFKPCKPHAQIASLEMRPKGYPEVPRSLYSYPPGSPSLFPYPRDLIFIPPELTMVQPCCGHHLEGLWCRL